MEMINSFVVLLLISISAAHACDFHPSFWCSSKEIARQCRVFEHCNAFVWADNSVEEDDDKHYWKEPKPVELGFYYETLCPDCQVFMRNQLWPTHKSVADIFNVDLVPYGNAKEHQEGGKWVFDCQHGEEECFLNSIQTCALKIYQLNTSFPFIACMESTKYDSAKVCAEKLGLSYTKLEDCTQSSQGNQWQHEMAQKTNALYPKHEYVPWVTLNGVHTEDIQIAAQHDLLGLICDTYKGPKPDACKRRERKSRIFGCTKNF